MCFQVSPSFKELKLSKETLGKNNHVGKDACRSVVALVWLFAVLYLRLKKIIVKIVCPLSRNSVFLFVLSLWFGSVSFDDFFETLN